MNINCTLSYTLGRKHLDVVTVEEEGVEEGVDVGADVVTPPVGLRRALLVSCLCLKRCRGK